jgi:hypothetical protein
MKYLQRKSSVSADQQFDQTKDPQQRPLLTLRHDAAQKAAQSQSEHESGHHHRYRLDIHAVQREQSPLPHDLVEQGRESRDKEKQIPPGLGIRQRTAASS